MRYRDRIDAQKGRNPCLTGLSTYLARPGLLQRCRLGALDFFDAVELPVYTELATKDLDARLQCDHQYEKPQGTNQRLLGQLLIIEDISPELIEKLGSALDVDPWFFASYIDSPWRSPRFTKPQNCCLPSRQRSQDFLSLTYDKSLFITGKKPDRFGFLRDSNQQRKLVVLPETTEGCVGLAQHGCGIFLKEMERTWIGIFLVDPPVTDEYQSSTETGLVHRTLSSRPFMGGPEDFNAFQDWTSPKLRQETSRNRGMLDELVYHWAIKPPTMFNPRRPTLQGLSYLPLNIVVAEWVNYISLMSFSLKQYEASSLSSDLQLELDKLSANLRTLQTWRRRVLASMDRIGHLIRYLKLHEPANTCSKDWAALREDYEFISTSIQENGNRLEAMIPVATSFIQLVESRRALLETTNVTRLTVLAIVFVPLSFVASLFSMSEKFGPGGQNFWLYFAVAIPITLFVLVVAGVPKPDWFSFRLQRMRSRFWRRKSRIL